MIVVELGLVLMAESGLQPVTRNSEPAFPEHILEKHRFPEILIIFLISMATEFGASLSIKKITKCDIPNHYVAKEDKTILSQQ